MARNQTPRRPSFHMVVTGGYVVTLLAPILVTSVIFRTVPKGRDPVALQVCFQSTDLWRVLGMEHEHAMTEEQLQSACRTTYLLRHELLSQLLRQLQCLLYLRLLGLRLAQHLVEELVA